MASSKMKYPKIQDLSKRVKEAFVPGGYEGSKSFLPRNKLDVFVTEDRVKSALREAEVEDPELDDLANFAVKYSQRLFLILLLMSSWKEQQLSLLRDFKRNRITDSSLPLVFYVYDCECKARSLEEPSDERKLFIVPDWDNNDCISFKSHQWKLTAPVFTREKFYYKFTENHILPFLHVPKQATNSGFFGDVSKLQIHRAHVPELPAVRSLAPLFAWPLT